MWMQVLKCKAVIHFIATFVSYYQHYYFGLSNQITTTCYCITKKKRKKCPAFLICPFIELQTDSMASHFNEGHLKLKASTQNHVGSRCYGFQQQCKHKKVPRGGSPGVINGDAIVCREFVFDGPVDSKN